MIISKSFGAPLGAPPLLLKQNPLLPLILGAIAGGGSIVSSLFTNSANKDMQKSANATNIRLQQLANEQSLANMRESNSFTERMWNAANTYNSPSAVKQRLLQAGINPQMAINGETGLAGNVSSVGSPSAEAAHVEPSRFESPNFSSLSDGVAAGASSYESIQRGINQALNNDYEPLRQLNEVAETSARISSIKANTEQSKALKDQLSAQLDEYLRTYEERRETARDAHQLSQKSLQVSDNQMKNADKASQQRDLELGIQSMLAQSNIKLNASQADSLAASASYIRQQLADCFDGDGVSVKQLENTLRNKEIMDGLRVSNDVLANTGYSLESWRAFAIVSALKSNAELNNLNLNDLKNIPDWLRSATKVVTPGDAARLLGGAGLLLK